MRLVATLATAVAVVWLLGTPGERDDEAIPSLGLAHKVGELKDGIAQVAASIPELEPASSDPVPPGGGDTMPAPSPDAGRALPEDATIASPEPFVVDDEAPQAAQTPATPAEMASRSRLDRDETDAIRSRLDRVMTLAAGSER